MDHAQIECPECAQQITVNSSAAVDNVECPYCKFTVVIPPSSQEPMLQEPSLNDEPDPDLPEPLLDNFSVEPSKSEIKTDSFILLSIN